MASKSTNANSSNHQPNQNRRNRNQPTNRSNNHKSKNNSTTETKTPSHSTLPKNNTTKSTKKKKKKKKDQPDKLMNKLINALQSSDLTQISTCWNNLYNTTPKASTFGYTLHARQKILKTCEKQFNKIFQDIDSEDMDDLLVTICYGPDVVLPSLTPNQVLTPPIPPIPPIAPSTATTSILPLPPTTPTTKSTTTSTSTTTPLISSPSVAVRQPTPQHGEENGGKKRIRPSSQSSTHQKKHANKKLQHKMNTSIQTATYLLKQSISLIYGNQISYTEHNWIVPDAIGYETLTVLSDPEQELDDIAETMEDECTYGDMILGTPSLQLCIVAAIGLGGIMSAATRKTLTKTKNKSSAAWISNNNINKNQKEKQEDPLAIVNGLVMCAQAMSTAQFVCGMPRMGEYCYDMKHMIGTPLRHRLNETTMTSVLHALTKRNTVPRYIDAWIDIFHSQIEAQLDQDKINNNNKSTNNNNNNNTTTTTTTNNSNKNSNNSTTTTPNSSNSSNNNDNDKGKGSHISTAMASFINEDGISKSLNQMGKILIYGMGAAPDSDCSDGGDDSEDSENEDTAESYDFMEEGLFDSFLAMHIRLSLTMDNTKEQQKEQNEQKEQKEELEELKEQKFNDLNDLNEQEEKEVLVVLKRYERVIVSLPSLETLIQDAARTKAGRKYLTTTSSLSDVFIQLFEMLTYVPIDDLVNLRRVATLLRGFAVWCTVLHALRLNCNNSTYTSSTLHGQTGKEILLQIISNVLLNEKWCGFNEKYSMINIQKHTRRNALRQVRIPRKSDFEEMMERRKHSWVRPLRSCDQFLNQILLAFNTYTGTKKEGVVDEKTDFNVCNELYNVLKKKKKEINNVISSDEDLLRTVLWWYGKLVTSLPLPLKLQHGMLEMMSSLRSLPSTYAITVQSKTIVLNVNRVVSNDGTIIEKNKNNNNNNNSILNLDEHKKNNKNQKNRKKKVYLSPDEDGIEYEQEEGFYDTTDDEADATWLASEDDEEEEEEEEQTPIFYVNNLVKQILDIDSVYLRTSYLSVDWVGEPGEGPGPIREFFGSYLPSTIFTNSKLTPPYVEQDSKTHSTGGFGLFSTHKGGDFLWPTPSIFPDCDRWSIGSNVQLSKENYQQIDRQQKLILKYFKKVPGMKSTVGKYSILSKYYDENNHIALYYSQQGNNDKGKPLGPSSALILGHVAQRNRWYECCGRCMGLAIMSRSTLGIRVPILFFSILQKLIATISTREGMTMELDVPSTQAHFMTASVSLLKTYEAIQDLDPEFYQSLKQIMNHNFEKDGSLDMYFTYTDVTCLNEEIETETEEYRTTQQKTSETSETGKMSETKEMDNKGNHRSNQSNKGNQSNNKGNKGNKGNNKANKGNKGSNGNQGNQGNTSKATQSVSKQRLKTFTKERLLVPNGDTIEVNDANKELFVQLFAERHILNHRYDAFRWISTGMLDVFSASFYLKFTPKELQSIVTGNQEAIDIVEWQECCQYERSGEEDAMVVTSQTVVWFWEWVEKGDQDRHRALLEFWSGSKYPPVFGFKQLDGEEDERSGFKIYRARERNSTKNSLPTAATCDRRLELPTYKSYGKLAKAMEMACYWGSNGFSEE